MQKMWAASILFVTGCSTIGVPIPASDYLSSDIESSHETWKSAGLGQYNFVYSVSSFPYTTPAVRVSVRSKEVRSVVYDQTVVDRRFHDEVTRNRSVLDRYPSMARTIGELFEVVRSCSGECMVRQARFHPKLGFPVIIEIDHREMTDSWAAYEISGFEVVGK